MEFKEYFLAQLTYISRKFDRKIVLCFDSIDQLCESDYDIEWTFKDLPQNVKIIYSALKDHGFIKEQFETKFHNDNEAEYLNTNFLEVDELNRETSLSIIENLLAKANRQLTRIQLKIVDDLFGEADLYPLYVKLMFDIIVSWQSYFIPSKSFYSCVNIDECIKYSFKLLEAQHGKTLFSRCCLYLTLCNKNGLSESELEDILSIDDDVLTSVFVYHAPPTRRFPIFLWIHIKSKLEAYLTIKEVDEIQVE